MDSLTHIALGAAIGEVVFGKKLGKRAMFTGAVAQSIPDIDFLASLWMTPANNLLAHRGFTHSFLFAIITVIPLSLLAQRWFLARSIILRQWAVFFGLQLSIHLLLDAFNAYGTGWFEPFSHTRISFHTLFVVDPFYSIWLGVGLIALLLMKKDHPQRLRWAIFGLSMSTIYLCYTVFNKISINNGVEKALQKNQISHKRFFTTPTPLNNWLWYVVAEDDSGYHVAHHSVFKDESSVHFSYFPRNESLLEPVHDHEDLQHLLRFSQGYYTVEHWGDTLIFNDLRFGQIAGWADPKAKFAFHYYLEHPDENLLVIQRGRFAGWNRETTRSLVERIGF